MAKPGLLSQTLHRLAVILTTAFVLVVTSTAAYADAVEEVGIISETVFANWSVTDSSGCILTQVVVIAADASLRGDGMIGRSASVHASQFNFCTNAFLYGDGETLSPVLNIGQSLGSASLQGDVTLCGASSAAGVACFNVSMNLAWSSTSEIQPVNNTDQFRVGDTIVIAHANGGVRNAIAFGNLTGGGVSWVAGGSQQAFIALSRSSGITITHQ